MKSLSQTVALCISLLMLVVSSASAAMPCCCESDAGAMAQMAQSEMDMPCHEANDSEKPVTLDCSDCNCLHMLKLSVTLPSTETLKSSAIAERVISAPVAIIGISGDTIFQPPKQLS